MDEIKIEGLQVFANHGVYKAENELGQKFIVNATLYVDVRKAGITDDLSQSVDYGTISKEITEYMQSNTFKLIESVAEGVANKLLLKYSLIKKVAIQISKPWAPVGLPLDSVSVRITRGWHRAYIAIGSNMGDKKGYLDKAVDAISKMPGTKLVKTSSYITTEPYGGVEQDDFLNGAVAVDTLLKPEELLDQLHIIENENGRTREIHWGPRTLDLDILLYDDLVYADEDLIIPHIDMHNRDFVLAPMNEIAPYAMHPVMRQTVSQLFYNLKGN